jgi:hypothetical protein
MLSTEIATITPKMAEEWLEGHENYRAAKPRVVDIYASDMESGNWELNGESIKFDENQVLVDGQHRLMSCVKSNCNFQSIVVRGVGNIDNLDTGARRTYKDILARRGEKNSTNLAACITWAYRIENEIVPKLQAVTISALESYYSGNQGIRNAISLFVSKFKPCPLPGSKAAALYYAFAKKDPEMAMDFFESLTTGESLKADDPVFTLRRTLLAMKSNRKIKSIDPVLVTAYTIKAWNGWREGRSMAVTRWTRFGKNREAFPDIA